MLVVLRRDKKGELLLLDPKGLPIEPARAFLTSLDTRGLSLLTIRAYAYDLLAL
jgi:hypothetical protein